MAKGVVVVLAMSVTPMLGQGALLEGYSHDARGAAIHAVVTDNISLSRAGSQSLFSTLEDYERNYCAGRVLCSITFCVTLVKCRAASPSGRSNPEFHGKTQFGIPAAQRSEVVLYLRRGNNVQVWINPSKGEPTCFVAQRRQVRRATAVSCGDLEYFRFTIASGQRGPILLIFRTTNDVPSKSDAMSELMGYLNEAGFGNGSLAVRADSMFGMVGGPICNIFDRCEDKSWTEYSQTSTVQVSIGGTELR